MNNLLGEHAVLAQLAIGHAPMLNAQRAVVGCRLSLSLQRPDAEVDGAAVVQVLRKVWPGGLKAATASGPAAFAIGTVALNVVGEPLLRAMLSALSQSPLPAPFALEIPSFMLGDAEVTQALLTAAAARQTLWLKGRVSTATTPALAACFSRLLFDVDEPAPARRAGAGAVATGLHSLAEMDAAFNQGAIAAAGWPLGEAPSPQGGRLKVGAEVQVVMELISRIEREEPVEKLEATLKGDPALAFRLLRYLNSAAFGLRVEITSFRHALMMLGYQKLKRWLALLLTSASTDANLVPVMYAAVRRGLLMEELGRTSGDADMRSEMFICGVFSLLDRMLKQPFDELLRSVPMPERVARALVAEAGPFMPYLELARAVETGTAYELRECSEALMLGAGEVNRAVLTALLAAQELE